MNQGWIARAEKGSGVRGGPERTPTSYFYQSGGWMPFGSGWGAPFKPTKTCEIATPSEEPFPYPTDANGDPIFTDDPGASFDPFPFPSP